MSAPDEKVVAKEVGEAVVSLIEQEVQAVMNAAEVAHVLVDKVAHDASEHSILEGQPPDTGVRQFWAQLLREVTRADPNTPTPE
jgi:hypothetical protein